MVKPVILDFDIVTHNQNSARQSEPEQSFISFLDGILQKKDVVETVNSKNVITEFEESNHTKNDNQDKYFADMANKNELSTEKDAKHVSSFNDRRLEKEKADKEKLQLHNEALSQFLTISNSNTINSRATLTKNKDNPVRMPYRDMNISPRRLLHGLDTSFAKSNNTSTNDLFSTNTLSGTKKGNSQSLHDVIANMQKIINDEMVTNSKKGDIKKLIANLVTIQKADPKTMQQGLIARQRLEYNELSNTKKPVKKNSGVTEKFVDNNAPLKNAKNNDTIFINAVRHKETHEDLPKTKDVKASTVEHHETFNNVNTRNGVASQSSVQNVAHEKVINNSELMQLLQKARIMQEGEKTNLSLKMYPESLGRLHIQLGLEQGIVNGRFTVESEQARQQLMQQLDVVRYELEQSGVHVGGFEVHVRDQRQTEFFQHAEAIPLTQNAEYEEQMSRYSYHDGMLDIII
ncbi:MAG: flagellar hook-length control protein FliK [Spirochaetes bacterium]|nr:flagellar hook-length control protein FliK [Spirochaetota bacterium]